MPLDRSDLLASLEASTSELARLLGSSDLDAPVGGCPPWRLRDLAHHLGAIHEWATAATRSDAPPPLRDDRPADEQVAAWYAGTAASLLERLRAADPDEPCWHFGAKPRTVGWWLRRQAHEASVHLWDARAALGDPEDLDPVIAADGVEEVLDVFVPRQVRLERVAPLTASVRLVATDTDLDRVLGEGPPTGTVSGPASDLLLVLWRRLPLERLDVQGDASSLRTAGLVP